MKVGDETAARESDDRGRIAALEAELRALREDHATLRAELTALTEVERFRDVVLRRHSVATLPTSPSCKLDAVDFAEQSNGLYYLEYGSGGEPYRWTGPGHDTRVRFNVDRSVPTRVMLLLGSLGANTTADTLTVEADGIVYVLRATPGDPLLFEAGPLPPRGRAGATDLLFHVPVLFSPGNADDVDARRLGVALRGVEIGPA